METNYQNQQPQGYQPQESLPNSTLILVLGILSILVCQLLGIVALIMGNSSLNLYQQNPGRYSESSASQVRAGRICGIIGICIMAIFIILLIAGVGVASWFGLNSHNLD
jgi:ABC-type Fe3+ transport system permease subunit